MLENVNSKENLAKINKVYLMCEHGQDKVYKYIYASNGGWYDICLIINPLSAINEITL